VTSPHSQYRLAPGVEIVAIGETRFQFRSDFVALEMSGAAASDFVRDAVASLTEPQDFEEIASRMSGYRRDSLRQQLESLVDEGVLVVGAREERPSDLPNRPFRHLLDEIGLGAEATTRALAAKTVAVLGLEAHGAHVALMLADAGVGSLVLVDPYPFEDAHRYLTPVSAHTAIGVSRQVAIAGHLSRDGLEIALPATGDVVDHTTVTDVIKSCDIAIACWDRGMSAANHWANEAAHISGTPILFGEVRATSCFAGPFVFPSRTACLMCYRMRSLACETDFESAMAYEEHMDRQRRPGLADRPILPILPVHLSSILALEALRYLIRLNQPRLVDRVLEFDALQIETRSHPVLVEPGCPVCGKKNSEHIPAARSFV
jgi:bacteriocin biosynthesis cyclodehydratase domain-containing protein